jgi:biotin carboxyl carrier protein
MALTRTPRAGTGTGINAKSITVSSSAVLDAGKDCRDKKSRCKTLIIDGDKYRTRYNTKFEKRKIWNNPNPKKVTSSIPGTIVKVYTKAGQEVKKGDPMLILEAMKMRNKILFHIDGKVKAIRVKEGEIVPKNHLLLEMA